MPDTFKQVFPRLGRGRGELYRAGLTDMSAMAPSGASKAVSRTSKYARSARRFDRTPIGVPDQAAALARAPWRPFAGGND